MADIRPVQVAEGFHVFAPYAEGALFSEMHFIYNEVFVERDYLKHGIRIPHSARVVDVGANVGMFSLFVMRERPDARVLALEPIPDIHQALLKNLSRYGSADVNVVRAALGRCREEQVAFTYFPALPGNSTRHPEEKQLNKKLVEEQIGPEAVDRVLGAVEVEADVLRLSDVLREWEPEGRIDLLKIDVEGSELEVLEGLDDSDWRRIRQCVIEVQDLEGRLETVVGMLGAQGFTVVTERAANIPDVLRHWMVYATDESG
ncbi:FkbM family methyltransferase [Streptomyces sp. NPDC055239]